METPPLAASDQPSISIHPDARNWITDGIRLVRDEIERFLRTAGAMMAHPRRFAEDWTRGETKPFNPMGFFATSVGVTGAFGFLVERVTPHTAEASLLDGLIHEADPYFQYFFLGLLCHLLLKPWGLKRPWFLTLGISLYAGGGPAAMADIATNALSLVVEGVARPVESLSTVAVSTVATLGILLANIVFFVAFALGLQGVHKLKLWRIVLSLLGAQIVLVGLRIVFFKIVLSGTGE